MTSQVLGLGLVRGSCPWPWPRGSIIASVTENTDGCGQTTDIGAMTKTALASIASRGNNNTNIKHSHPR